MGGIYSKCREAFVWMGEMQTQQATDIVGSSAISETDEKCYHFYGDETDFDGKWEDYLSTFTFKDGEERNPGAISGVVADLSASAMSLHCAWLLRSLAAGYYIELTSSLLPLSFAGLKNRYPELPSWAIDWTIFEQSDGEQYEVWKAILPLFRLSNDLPTAHIKVEEEALIARGVEVDVITALGTTMDQSTHFAFQASLESWRDLILLKHDPENPYAMGSTWNDAWLRTLCADCCWGANSARRANSHDIAFFSANLSVEFQDLLLSDHQKHHSTPSSEFFRLENGMQVPSDAHFNDIWGMIKSVIQGRKLFLTKKGYLGLSNKGILSGNTMFIFPGAPTPSVYCT
ncbi:uncharacterized protein PAC_01308 [Phialocephala subalpina]|uniref:Heterokaryon incompatibility domain-containing protein n=1 Tax=Phialocephala subalpina TaxID=576137 RepID=A0A1L7WF89_9HELO|nr:uncharacterized protein PAC_01308 [Phialocephala subalpina]